MGPVTPGRPPASPAKEVDPKAALERRKRQEAVRGFEEMFLVQMLKTMRQTVPEGEECSEARRRWREQLDGVFARKIAESGGIGLAPLLERGIVQGTATAAGNGKAGKR